MTRISIAGIACVALTCAVAAHASGTIADGDATYTIDNGVLGDRETTGAGTGGFDPGNGYSDQLFQNWWWYRVAGGTREYALSNLLSESYVGNTATLVYAEPEGFTATLVLVLVDGASDGEATATWTVTIENTSGSQLDIELFNYLDYDLGVAGGAAGDRAAILDPGTDDVILAYDGTDFTYGTFSGPGSGRWAIAAFSGLRTSLTDADVDDLPNSVNPFGPGDFSAAFQWSLSIAAGQSDDVTEVLALRPPLAATGACCLPNGSCAQSDFLGCGSSGGVYQGDGSDCGGVSCPQPPGNDQCDGAIALNIGDCVLGSTRLATADAAPTCVVSNTSPGVWYRVIGNGQALTASTCSGNTNFETKLSVYRDGCAFLTCVTGNDDAGALCPFDANQSIASWCGEDGVEYLILVHGLTAAVGEFELCVTTNGQTCPPENDACDGAQPMNIGDCVQGDTSFASADFAPDCITTNTTAGVWYSVLGDGTVLTASTCTSINGYDTKLSVYTDGCSFLTCVGGNDDAGSGCAVDTDLSIVAWCSEPGREYLILVHGFAATGPFELCVTSSGGVCPPNDTCDNPQLMSIGDCVQADTSGSTFDAVPTCGTSNTSPGIWYRVVGDGTGLTATTCGSINGFDTKLSIFRDGCALSCITGNDDAGATVCPIDPDLSTVRWCGENGVEYLILVHGLNSEVGPFELCVTSDGVSCPPVNDLCDGALPIAAGECIVGSTRFATFDAAPTCVTTNTAPGVWYRLNGTGTGVTVTTCAAGSDYDTKLSVYRDGCGALTCVTGNDDAACSFSGLRSTVNFCAESGVEYLILVHGFTSATGQFELCVIDSGLTCPAPNDLCGDAIPLNIGDCVQSSTAFATPDAAPTCNGVTDTANGVWYRVTGDGTTLKASTCTSINGFDTKISVYRDGCGGLTCVTANDDVPLADCPLDLDLSIASWCSRPGVEYLILVHGASQVGPFELCITSAGDDCITGACCLPGGDCQISSASGCAGQGGAFQGADTDCGQFLYAVEDCSSEFEDISATGLPGPQTDDSGLSVSIGFAFPYFGNSYTDLSISSNGYLVFPGGGSASDLSNDPIPSVTPPNNIICLFWDDLNPASSAGGDIWYETRGSPNRLIVQYQDVRRFGSTTAILTAQVVLFDDGAIVMRYTRIDNPAGFSASIGVEDATGTIGIAIPQGDIAPGVCKRFSFTLQGNPCPTEPCAGSLRGDANCDGVVDNGDIDCFVASLLDASGDLWRTCALAVNPTCGYDFVCTNDVNGDTAVDNADIDAFVECLLSQPNPGEGCP